MKKILQKTTEIALIFAMCFCMAACGATSSSIKPDTKTSENQQEDNTEIQSFAIIPDEYITQKNVGIFEGKEQYDVVLNADCNMDDKEEYIAVLGSEENFITGDTYTVARLKRSQYAGFRESAVKNKHPEAYVFFVNKNLVSVDSNETGEEKDVAIVSAIFAYIDSVEQGIITASEIHVPLIDGIDKYGNPIKCYEAEQWHVYYKDGIVNQRYPIKPQDVPGVDYNEYNRVFGLQNIKWHDAPKTHDEFLDDFLYAYIRGAWEIDDSGLQNFDGVFRYLGVWIQPLGAEWVTRCYSALLGDYTNCFETYAYLGDDNKFYIYTSGDKYPVTHDEMMQRIDLVYQEVMAMQKRVHDTNPGIEFATDIEKVKAYYNYIIPYYDSKGYDADYTDPKYYEYSENARSVICDGAWNTMINYHGACAPREATFHALMNNEGIFAYGVAVGSHVVTLIRTDGKIYIVDWGNRVEITELNDPLQNMWFVLMEDDCAYTETRLGIPLSQRAKPYVCFGDKYFYIMKEQVIGNKIRITYDYKYVGIGDLNYYSMWFSDGTKQVYSNDFAPEEYFRGKHNVEVDKVAYESLNNPSRYLLTKSLSDKIKNGEITFEEAIKPDIEYQSKSTFWEDIYKDDWKARKEWKENYPEFYKDN